MQKIISSVLILSALSIGALAQNLPVYNYYFNAPFFYNPSYAGANKQAEINLLYRQQRISLGGAPSFSFVTLTLPFAKKMGFGLSAYNQEKGVITTNSAQGSFSYKVQFGRQTYLSFGLSAGLGKDGLDVSQVDVNDPAVAQQLDKNFYLQGQAGINFQLRKLNIGFSLPQFFDQSIVDVKTFHQAKINPLNTSISSIKYSFQMGKNISFQPILMYKTSKTNTQIEVYGITYLKDIFWLGGLYRQDYGMAALTGFQISQRLRCGYSYEFPTSQLSKLISSTHEFSVSLKLGKKPSMVDQTEKDKTKSVPSELKRKKKKSKGPRAW